MITLVIFFFSFSFCFVLFGASNSLYKGVTLWMVSNSRQPSFQFTPDTQNNLLSLYVIIDEY